VDAVLEWAGERGPTDDLTLLVARKARQAGRP
jgi:hypothetical protein